MNTNYDELLPKKILLSIKDLDFYGILKSDMCKKLILQKKLEIVKIGSKNFISRSEVIRYLEAHTVPAVNTITYDTKQSA